MDHRAEAIIVPSLLSEMHRYEEYDFKVVGIRIPHEDYIILARSIADMSIYLTRNYKSQYLEFAGVPVKPDTIDSVRFETEVKLREFQEKKPKGDR